MTHKLSKICLFNLLALCSFIGAVANQLITDEQLAYTKLAYLTQADMNLKAADDYKQVDQELNSVYQKIQSKYKKNPTFLNKLKTSQQAWLKLRDARVNEHFPLEPGEQGRQIYGSGYDLCISKLMTKITQERIVQLNAWLQYLPKGQSADSVAIKS